MTHGKCESYLGVGSYIHENRNPLGRGLLLQMVENLLSVARPLVALLAKTYCNS